MAYNASRLGSLHRYPSSFIPVSNHVLVVYLHLVLISLSTLLLSGISFFSLHCVGSYRTFICTTSPFNASSKNPRPQQLRCVVTCVMQVPSRPGLPSFPSLGIACTLLIYIPQCSLHRCVCKKELWPYAYLFLLFPLPNNASLVT